MKNSPAKFLTKRISKICPSLSIFSCLTSPHMAAAVHVRSIQLKSGGRLRTFPGALKQETFWNSSHIFFPLPFSFLFFVAHSLSDVWPRHPDIFNLHLAFCVSRIFSRPNVAKWIFIASEAVNISLYSDKRWAAMELKEGDRQGLKLFTVSRASWKHSQHVISVRGTASLPWGKI